MPIMVDMRLFLLCAVAAFGQDVAKLGWMAGSWTGTRGRASIEEHWTQPNGNAMLAVSKTVVALTDLTVGSLGTSSQAIGSL